MSEAFTNNGQTTLNGAINNSVTSLSLTSAATFPTKNNFRIRIDDEIMFVSAISGTTLTVARGQEGTTAVSHLDLATVREVLTAAVMGNTNPWDGVIVKASDSTVTSSTAYVADSELTFTPVSNGVYEIEVMLAYSGGGGLKHQLQYPSNDGFLEFRYIDTGGNLQVGNLKTTGTSTGDRTGFEPFPTTNRAGVTFRGVLAVRAATAIAVYFAQGSSSGTSLKLLAGSMLRYRRIA